MLELWKSTQKEILELKWVQMFIEPKSWEGSMTQRLVQLMVLITFLPLLWQCNHFYNIITLVIHGLNMEKKAHLKSINEGFFIFDHENMCFTHASAFIGKSKRKQLPSPSVEVTWTVPP